MDTVWQVAAGVVGAAIISAGTAWLGSMFTIAKLGIHIDYMGRWQADHESTHVRLDSDRMHMHSRIDDEFRRLHKRIDDVLSERNAA